MDGGWISCRERLPEDRELHYVTVTGGSLPGRTVRVLWYCGDSCEWMTTNGNRLLTGWKVIAWTERPAPYEGQ